jgi:galactonate dehydratase
VKSIKKVVASCEAVRDELGDCDFALDFHGKLTASAAVVIEAAIRHTKPLWIEEPVSAESPQELTRCVERFSTPIAVGERLFTRWAFLPILGQQLAGIIQPDVSNAGGISELWKIAALAEAYGVAFAPHNPNGPLQVLASLHLAASAQMFGMLEHRHDSRAEFARIGGPLVDIGPDGCCGLPQGVGLGGAPNEEIFSRPVTGKIHESFRADGAIDDW